MGGAGGCAVKSLFSFCVACKVIVVIFRNVLTYNMLQRKWFIEWLEAANTEMSGGKGERQRGVEMMRTPWIKIQEAGLAYHTIASH